MAKTAMDYGLLSFRQLSEVSLETGEFEVTSIERYLKQGNVSNFAGSYFESARGTRLTLTKKSAIVALVEVQTPKTCYMEAGFFTRAYSAGYGKLEQAAGPFLALAKGVDVTSVTVITNPFVIGVSEEAKRDAFLWKILKPALGGPTLAVVNSRERVEGKKVYAFAKVSNST